MLKNISVLVIILIASGCALQNDIPELSVEEVKAKIDSTENILLLDVRTPEEFEGTLGHIEGAILIPLQELDDRIEELEKYNGHEIIVVCRSGNRSSYGTKTLLQKGFNAFNMAGGMIAWNTMLQSQKKEKVEE